MFKHLARIQEEFMKFARNWDDLPYEYQVGYLKRHPDTKRKITARPTPVSPTSGLKIHAPSRGHAHPLLDLLRSTTNASTDKPIQREYLTMREGTANKFHYFAVFPTKDGQYAAANAWGRIGYPAKGAIIIAKSPSKDGAIFAMNEKLEKKLKKGYGHSKMSEEESDTTPQVTPSTTPQRSVPVTGPFGNSDSEVLLREVLKENKRLRKMLEERRVSI